MDLLLITSLELLLGEVFTANNVRFFLAHQGMVLSVISGLEDFHVFPDDAALFRELHIYHYISAFPFISYPSPPFSFLQIYEWTSTFFFKGIKLRRVSSEMLSISIIVHDFLKKTCLVLQGLPCASKLSPNSVLCCNGYFVDSSSGGGGWEAILIHLSNSL